MEQDRDRLNPRRGPSQPPDADREEREQWAFRVGLAAGLVLVAFVAAGVVGLLAPCFR